MNEVNLNDRVAALESQATKLANWLKAAGLSAVILAGLGIKLKIDLGDMSTTASTASETATKAKTVAEQAQKDAGAAAEVIAGHKSQLEERYRDLALSLDTLASNKADELSGRGDQIHGSMSSLQQTHVHALESMQSNGVLELEELLASIKAKTAEELTGGAAAVLAEVSDDLLEREFTLSFGKKGRDVHYLNLNNGEHANGILTGAAESATPFRISFK